MGISVWKKGNALSKKEDQNECECERVTGKKMRQ